MATVELPTTTTYTYSLPPLPGPLTTVFTAPASCTTLWIRGMDPDESLVPTIYRNTDATTYGLFSTECFPKSLNFAVQFDDRLWYSPGVCPDQWTIAATRTYEAGGGAMCCPSDFSYPSDYWCEWSISKTTLSAYDVAYQSTGSLGVVISPTTAFPITFGLALVGPVPIRWAFSDLLNLPTTAVEQLREAVPVPAAVASSLGLSTIFSNTASKTTTSTSFFSPPTSAALPPTTTSNPQTSVDRGLGTGTKAGIGAGIVVLILLSLILTFFFYRRGRKRCKENTQNGEYSGKAELDGPEHTNAKLKGNEKHVQVLELPMASIEHEKAHELEVEEGGREKKRQGMTDSELEGDKLYPQELMSSSPLQLELTEKKEIIASLPTLTAPNSGITTFLPPTQTKEIKIDQEVASSATNTAPLSTHLTPEADAEMRLLQQEEQRILARQREILKQAGG